MEREWRRREDQEFHNLLEPISFIGIAFYFTARILSLLVVDLVFKNGKTRSFHHEFKVYRDVDCAMKRVDNRDDLQTVEFFHEGAGNEGAGNDASDNEEVFLLLSV